MPESSEALAWAPRPQWLTGELYQISHQLGEFQEGRRELSKAEMGQLSERLRKGLEELKSYQSVGEELVFRMEGHIVGAYDPETDTRQILYSDEPRNVPNTGVHEMAIWEVQSNGVWVVYEDDEGPKIRFLEPASIRLRMPQAIAEE